MEEDSEAGAPRASGVRKPTISCAEADKARCHTIHTSSRGGLPVVSLENLRRVAGIMACCPVRPEVERALSAQSRIYKQQPLAVTTRADVMGSLSKYRHSLATAEEFRKLLLQHILQYVCNSAAACEAGLSHDPGFSAQLKSWIQQLLIPLLKTNLLSEYVPALEAVVCSSAASQEGGLHQNPTSSTAKQVARALHFGEFQHQNKCCERCAVPCDPSMEQGFVCDCGAIVCRQECYGLSREDYRRIVRSDQFKFECDSCREQHCGKPVVSQKNHACFSCRILLGGPHAPGYVQCPMCQGYFCHGCACISKSEVAAVSPPVLLPCSTCVGQDEYEESREKAVCFLFRKAGSSASCNPVQLRKSKGWADQLGDLLYDLYYAGYRTVVEKHLPSFLDIVKAQLNHKIPPSVDPFHLLYYMGKCPIANTYLLAQVCRAQAEDALSKSRLLLPTAATSAIPSPPGERPAILRVGVYGFDLVQNSPLADLMWSPLQHFSQDQRYEIVLFADGPVDKTHPPAKDIAQLFKGRLHLFPSGMADSAKYAKFVEAKLNIVITLAGWTYGHLANVFAALGSGPSAIPVMHWLGWAGLMCMREGVHYMIAGSQALPKQQKQECKEFRERLSLLPIYQPCQNHPSHRDTGHPLTREHFNLPSAENCFIFCSSATLNRLEREVLFDWLGIVVRVTDSCLLLLSKPRSMHIRTKQWIKEYITEVDPNFDPARVIFRPVQKKPFYWGLLHAVGERGALLDTVWPIGPHTSASDALSNYLPILSWETAIGGMQQRVAIELLWGAGLLRECVARDRASFADFAVEFAGDRPRQLAIRSFLRRSVDEGINLWDTSLVPGAVLMIVEKIFQEFVAAGGDVTKLNDIDVCARFPPVRQFSDSPEAAALAADSEETRSQKAKREELLAQMLGQHPPLAEEMAPHALQIMQDHQEEGLVLDSIVGDGGFSVVIKATASRAINADVPPGTEVALKVLKEGVPLRHLKNASLIREGLTMIKLEARLRQKEFGNLFPKPVYVWSNKKNGRCFMGHSSADPKTSKVLAFLTEELITGNFRDAIKSFGIVWRTTAVFSEYLQYEFSRPMFQLAFELRYSARMAVMDVKPCNFALRPGGRLVAVDLGNAIVFDNEDDAAHAPAPLSRSITVAADSSGQAIMVPGRVLRGTKRKPQLYVISNQQILDFCVAHYEQGKGLGRVCKGTVGYSDQAALELRLQQKFISEEDGFREDLYAVGRSLLKELSYDPHKEQLRVWNQRACAAERAGQDGIRNLLLSVVPRELRVTQITVLDRLCDLLAGILHPQLELRLDVKSAMTHPFNTLPILSPQDYCAIHGGPGIEMPGGPVECGPGIEMPGGPVESLPAAIRLHPYLKGKELPPVKVMKQNGMGMGVNLRRAVKKGLPVAVYGGKKIAGTDKGGLRRAFPSRYSVTTRGAKMIDDDVFVCDAAFSKERPFERFIADNNAGPFMNGIDEISWKVNCNLDRHSAWSNGEDVWFVLYANRDIAAGEFLMWKYNHRAGASLLIPGVSFSFD